MHNDAPPVSAAALPPADAAPPGPRAADVSIGVGPPQQQQDDDPTITFSTGSEIGSCCSAVYAHRSAEFKRHTTGAASRQQRMQLNNSLRSQARAELLRQLREEAERQLQQEQELLQQQGGQQPREQQRRISRGHRFPRRSLKAPEECMDSRRLRQLLAHPQHIVQAPEELQSGKVLLMLTALCCGGCSFGFY